MTESTESVKRGSLSSGPLTLSIRNIGGIHDKRVTLDQGITLLTGPNATNRTSLLRAFSGALGGSAGVLRRGADTGQVTLTVDDVEYTRQYERIKNTVHSTGAPYTDDETVIDLFVSLLEDNPIRQAVRSGDNLTDLLLAPVDTDELESKIASLRSERKRVDERLNSIDRERKRLPKLEERRADIQEEISAIESKLDELRARTEDVDTSETESEGLESIRREFEETQTDLRRTESELETQRSIREELESDLEEIRDELAELNLRQDELEEVKQDIERLQGRETELSTTINELSTISKQNRDVLAGDDTIISELVLDDSKVSELDPESQSIECWTCGSQVERQAITSQLEAIERLTDEKRDERREVRSKLGELRSRRDKIEQEIAQHQELTDRETEIQRGLEERADAISELVDEAESLREKLAEKQSELEAARTEDTDTELDLYEEVSDLEYERGQLEQELRDVDDDISEIEYQLGKYDELQARREDLTEELESLRSRIETIERETVETFNQQMETVLDRLAYENIARVWLERRKTGTDTTFDLHIVREDESGTVYEDSVDHLSESEREVIGIVVALTGYLTHDVQEQTPVLLLDSLEAIDAARIEELVECIESKSEFLVVALLEEDAAAFDESYHRLDAVEQLG
jgi:predicted  nucleic acid-binding Zn-ribbon protein